MPDRYWVGGTAAWNNTAGTKWSATSGGPGGASVPTSADDVFFNASSTGTVTISTGNTGAKSINCTGFTGTLAGSGAITVSGSVTLAAAMGYTYTGTMTFAGTGTLTSAGKNFGACIIDGAGITITLGDALTMASGINITITQGTFDTNNFAVTQLGTAVTFTNNNLSKAINLGSSVLTCGGLNFGTDAASFVTFNAGTSQINFNGITVLVITPGTAPTDTVTGVTFNNVTLTGTAAGARNINGVYTFNNLTVTPPAAAGVVTAAFGGNQTITGTLTASGASISSRVALASGQQGTARTLTVGTLTASDCDFRDITLAGAAAPASPSGAGNCGNNTNITFPAAKTVYRMGTDTTWVGVNSWALSSGGSGSDANYPLAQDTVIINNDTALSGTLSMLATANVGAFDCSARTNALTLSFPAGASNFYHGSFTLGSGIAFSGTGNVVFVANGPITFTSAGKTIPFAVNVTGGNTTLTLADACASTTGIVLNRGTLNLAGFSVLALSLSSSNSNTRTLAAGSNASISLFGTGASWGFVTTTNLTITGTFTVTMTGATAKIFNGGDFNYPATLINGGAGALTINGSNTFIGLSNTVQPTSFLFSAGTTTTITNWNINGTAGNLVTIGSSSAASHTLSKASGAVAANYLSISRSSATGGATWNADNSTDGGNNTGWVFNAGPPPPPPPPNTMLFFLLTSW
jgi:hypothetical protein